MYCNEHVAVNTDGRTGVAVSLRCKCWHCEICQPFNRRALIRRGKNGDPNTFITLTVNPDRFSGPDERARLLVAAWRTVRRRIAKRYGCAAPAFLAVFEKTKRGEPHLHILCRSNWIDQRWLSDQMRDLIGAPIVDIRRIQDKGRAAAYVSKYAGKNPQRFERTRRFWTSRDWLDENHQPPPKPELPGKVWLKFRHSLDWIERQLSEQSIDYVRKPGGLYWGGTDPP